MKAHTLDDTSAFFMGVEYNSNTHQQFNLMDSGQPECLNIKQ
jgi:hypothetical protein